MAILVNKVPQAVLEKTPTKVRFRLLVLIPLCFCFFTLTSGYLTFHLSKYFFLDTSRFQSLDWEGYFWILAVIFYVTGLATLAGVALSHTITSPLKKLSARIETLVSKEALAVRAEGPLPANELDLLSRTLEKVFNSLESMIDGKSLEVLSEGVITLDREGGILQINKVAERVLGINSKDIVGKPFRDFFPDSAKYRVFENLIENTLKEPRTHTFEDVELLTQCHDSAGQTKTGSPLHLKGWVVPKRDENEEICGIMMTFQGSSDMEQIRRWLKHADRMAGLGTMAAGIAHEIRNPLASIRGLMELVKEDLSPADPHWSYTERVIKEVDRMNKLVEEVLEFAHMEAAEPITQDVNFLLKEALSSIKHRFPDKQLEVVEKLDGNLPKVLSRPEKLKRAFENIILNAFEAAPEGGRITITSSMRNGYLQENGTAKAVLLRFHNTGSFIPLEARERIFLPFYTTKTKGTGLGLPITHRVISSHGGQISVHSDQEKGTTFMVELPTSK